ncbi:glycosyltransferase family 9 protein, partial [Burkholderia pseudomallei]
PFIRTIFVTPPSLVRALSYLGGWLLRARRYDLTIDYDQYYCLSELIAGMSACCAVFRTSLKGRKFSMSVEYDPLLN